MELFEYTCEYHRLNSGGKPFAGIPLALYVPKERTEASSIAVLLMHRSRADFTSHVLCGELAKHGIITAGANPRHADPEGWIRDYETAVKFLKSYPGVKKVVLLGHSQAGNYMSCYQYIAENGTDRFKQPDRLVPFPEIHDLTPADGLMLMDANWGIMEVLCLDPAVRQLDNGWGRIPELDLYNPENGYDPNGSHYSDEFIHRFQKAQIDFYRGLLEYSKERVELIEKGRGKFLDDEPLYIAGGGMGSDNNKLFIQDPRLFGRTEKPCKTLLKDGSVVEKINYTVRKPQDNVRSTYYTRGAFKTTVREMLMEERRFSDDFGYNEYSMWGDEPQFNFLRTIANVEGITVPTLCTGNTASHEFVNAEMNYNHSISKDKDLIMFEGATHEFVTADMELYGDTLANIGTWVSGWLTQPGRFIE
ncbi:MAG: alpha/beta hydrolase [Lachnospiraceae bacterium]|nr:alpha/beta hydrolase [Lachnospiraceae bacterium]